MNERIKLLAKQAEIKWQHQEDAIYSTMTLEQFEKVAELIVRECLSLAYSHPSQNEDYAAGIDSVRESIKEHFGVEK